jgi:hypothetical protein
MEKSILIILSSIIAIPVIFVLIIYPLREAGGITSFDECIAAGNPAMESYPRQCRDPLTGRTFTEKTDDFWRFDNIELMQHKTQGYYGCFGCSQPNEGPALCIDPIPEMKKVEETESRYCSENFEVVESEDYLGNVGETCSANEDCKTPADFLIQSNCPFGSACIDSKCSVVCPLSYHDPNPEISRSYPVTCEADSDCDCSERGQRTIKCLCHDNACVSVEAE